MAMMHDTAKKPDHSAHNTHKDHQEQTKAPKHSEQKAHAEHSMSEGDDDTPMMTGMLSRNQMRALAASQGKTFDELFLTGMILHHQGALLMVDNLLKQPHAGEDPEISEFLASIYADQSSEILRMKYFLSEL